MNTTTPLDRAIALVLDCKRAIRIAGMNADFAHTPRQIVDAALLIYEAGNFTGIGHEAATLLRRQLAAANARVARLAKGQSDADKDGPSQVADES